jgi:hypothetical protein
MRWLGHPTYGEAMSDNGRGSLNRHPAVTITAAAELANVDVATLRGWVGLGSLGTEYRGDMEVVQLDEVTALASRHRASRNGALRDRLRQEDGSVTVVGGVVNIADLQALAREREN